MFGLSSGCIDMAPILNISIVTLIHYAGNDYDSLFGDGNKISYTLNKFIPRINHRHWWAPW